MHLAAVAARQMLQNSLTPSMLLFLSCQGPSRCFIYGHSGINIIIILINMMMIQLLKCIIETLMCGGTTMVAVTKCCDNVLVTHMEEYGDTEVYCDNVIELHDTSSSLPLPSLSGSGIHSSQK